jgi:hypothetical protein
MAPTVNPSRARYALVLLAMLGLAVPALLFYWQGERLDAQRKQLRLESKPVANRLLVERIARLPMPAQATELGDDLERLRELKQADFVRAIEAYASQQRLAQALGEPADGVETVGAARDWSAAYPTRVQDLSQRLLRDALGISLAAPDVPPPLAGRDGMAMHLEFVPAGDGLWRTVPGPGETQPRYAFVVDIGNRMRLPLRSFAFAVMPRDEGVLPQDAALPEHGFLWCDGAASTQRRDIPPGATTQATCSLQIPFIAKVDEAPLRQLMRTLRARPLVAWIKGLGAAIPASAQVASLQVTDYGVDAQFARGPSARVAAGFFALPTQRAAPLTSCDDRGDCAGADRPMPLRDLAFYVWAVVLVLLPGYLVAGAANLLGRATAIDAAVVFALLAATGAPWLFHRMGGGYGGLFALIIVICATAGYWVGYVAGRWSLRR